MGYSMNQPRELNATLVNELKALLGERATTGGRS